MTYRFYTIFVVAVLTLAFLSCGKKDGFDESSYEKIESITAGTIKRLDEIKIVFSEDVVYKGKVKDGITFEPKVEGVYNFVDERTFVFCPNSPYPTSSEEGGELSMRVDTGLLFEGVSGNKGFVKHFVVSPASLLVNWLPQSSGNAKDEVEVEAELETDIPCALEKLKSIFSIAREDGKSCEGVNIELVAGSSESSYLLSVKGIKREANDFVLLISYDGKSIDSNAKGERGYTILSKDAFEVVEHRVEDASSLIISFSDEVDAKNLHTQFFVESEKQFIFYIKQNRNQVRLISKDNAWEDGCSVTVLKGIASKNGVKSKKDYTFVIKDSWDVPSIDFQTSGNIVPSKEGATVLIKTRNIKGMYMQAINVYGKNMLQLLQYNRLGEAHNLDPVGEPVWEGSFQFEWRPDMKNRDVVRSIDITELVKKFPTGMFHLMIAFTKKDSMYVPKNPEEDFSHLPFPKGKFYKYYWLSGGDYWDEYEGQVSREGFWSQRKNPAHPAFYMPYYNYNLAKTKDILVSNIALMAKKESSGAVYARVCDIRTGKAVQGAKVKTFTFAQRELESGNTDKEGTFIFKKDKDVAFVQAEHNGSFAYLSLKDGYQMPTSHFEVDGERREDGVKGYIYGERGVWRPGDEMHLTFILQDEKNTLPEDIPVEFTLQDPFYAQVDRQVFTSSVDGMYRMDTKTLREGKTGTYTAKVKIGGNVWTKTLKVENIIPNRLFVELQPQGVLKTGLNTLNLKSSWLHGAKATGLKAEMDCSYSLIRTPFEEWKTYSFVSAYNGKNFSAKTEKIWQGVLNNEGEANVNLNMQVDNAPGLLKATFATRVYESSGAFSIENKTFPFSPYTTYIGLRLPEGEDSYRERMLYTGREHTVELISVDPKGKLTKGVKNCKLDLYKLEWRWWWENNAYSADSLYSSSSSIKNVVSDIVSIENGKGKWKFKIDNEEWGRYLLVAKDEASGHIASSVLYVDEPAWSRRSSDEVGIAETMLQIQAGKEKYEVGENVEIAFPSAKDSFAYITLEKAGSVLDSKVITGDGETVKYVFKATKEMSPNVYVHISLVQPYKNVQNSLPIRLYGVMPIKIEDAQTHLSPLILAKDNFESAKKASFKVKEKEGRAMAFTVYVVDEGLLGLTGFRQADPWNHFYRKEASSLASYDTFNSISGAFGGRIESLLAIGGSDVQEGGEGNKQAERFKSVALSLGPYKLNAKEEKQIEFDMPQYLGAVRLMVVARDGSSYGIASQQVKVASPLIVLPTFPRVLGVGDEMEVPITVFNTTSSPASVKVSLKGEGACNISEEQSINVGAMQNEIARFNIKASKKGKTVFVAKGMGSVGKDEASIEIDSVLKGTPYVMQKTLLMEGKTEQDLEIALPGEEGSRELFIEVSRLPSLGLASRLSYLLERSGFCLEEVVSKAFSQLYLPMFVEMSEEDIEKRKENIMFALSRLSVFQTASGGFSYWPSGRDASLWLSIYTGHFLTEARKMGFSVEESLNRKCTDYLADLAKNWTVGYRNDPDLQAYRLYVLALQGRGDLQAMNKLKSISDLSSLSKSLLANAYIILGKKDVGASLAKDVQLDFVQNERGLRNYGSTVRDVAMKLQTYTLLEEKNERVNACIRSLADISASDDYLCTQELAWILISTAPYYNHKKGELLKCEVFVEGEKREITLSKTTRLFSLKVSDGEKQALRVKNLNDESLYIALTAKSVLKKEEERNSSLGGLSLNVLYKRLNGEPIANPASIAKGERFFVVVQAKNASNVRLEDLLLNLPIPTGWEMTNNRVQDADEDAVASSSALSSSPFSYQDIKDTYVLTFFSLSSGESKQFVFEGTAVYGGSYRIPSIVLESLYDPSRRAVWKN